MYLAYVDESEDSNSFVLTAMAVNESRVSWASQAIDEVEKKHFGVLPVSERPILFHCTTIRNPSAFLARGKPKPKDKQLALLIATWDEQKRHGLLSDIYDVFISQSRLNLTLFTVVVDKQAAAGTNARSSDLSKLRYDRAFEELYTMFNSYLVRHHQGRVDPSRYLTGYGTQKGVFLMDRSARESTTKSQAATYRRQGTIHGTAYNIVETPVFMPSEDSRMLQLVDFAANATLRRYRPAPEQDSEFFDFALFEKLDREGTECHGLLHILAESAPHCMCGGRHYRSLTPP